MVGAEEPRPRRTAHLVATAVDEPALDLVVASVDELTLCRMAARGRRARALPGRRDGQ